jgi:alkanesulfonate monooxygenase SsuD/methylene tetrahydromethanopterin reductase-like flavin-dependent oxidoreductase (luciferase family)
VKFGLLYAFRNPAPWRKPFPAVHDQVLEQIAYAEALGFDAIWLTEHHFSPDGYSPSVLPLAAAVAARTRRVHIGTCVLLLPFYHPLRLAEDVAVADILSDGRLVLGIGSGYRAAEFAGYGVDRAARGTLMDEGMEILLRALRGENVTYRGRHWQIEGATLAPRPVQEPHPPVLLGRATSRRVLARAARLGVQGIAGIPSPDLLAYYEQALRRHGRDPSAQQYLALRWVYVAASAAEALAEIGPYATYDHDVYRGWWAEQDRRVMAGGIEDDYILGDPETCRARMLRMLDGPAAAQVEHFVIGQFSGVPHEQAMRQLERLARDIIAPLRNQLRKVEQ